MEMRKNKNSGIYKIVNPFNDKVYVGQTINFGNRFVAYKSAFKHRDKKHINPYLMNAFEKNGFENFYFKIIEFCKFENLIDRELHWILEFESNDPEKGYNLRMDTPEKMITHDLTRERMSQTRKKEYENGIRDAKEVSEYFKQFWTIKENREQMSQSLHNSKSNYIFVQKDRDYNIVNVWLNIQQILYNNPSYKWQNVYAACNGNKKSYKNYLWERVEKENASDYLLSLIDNSGYELIKTNKSTKYDEH